MEARHFIVTLLCLALSTLPRSNSQRPLEATIREESEPNAFVANIKQDSNLTVKYSPEVLINLRFNFRSLTGHYSLFTINSFTGEINTAGPINREDECLFEDVCDLKLDITVTPERYYEIIKLIVHVEDINDNSPIFTENPIQLDISETTSAGAMFTIPEAEDDDSGVNSVQNYSLVSLDRPSTLDKFRLRITDQPDGSKDVRLELMSRLDREIESSYRMQLIAVDGGRPQKSGSVIINVTVSDANDNNPHFLNATYHGQVYENSINGTPILRTQAVDPDAGLNGRIRYGFDSHTLARYGRLFSMNAVTGEITVRGEIDYEEMQVYTLQATASDMGPRHLTSFARVVIHVLDVNDESPSISVNSLTSSERVQVEEHSDIHTFVAYVSVTDPDSGVSGQFDCAVDSSRFNLEKHSDTDYKITTAQVFDREHVAQYTISMSCTDKGSPPLTRTVPIPIYISDINDNDPLLSANNYVVAFKENNTIGDVIHQINATDADEGRNAAIRYEIRGLNNRSINTVRIDPITGVVTARIVFNFEDWTQYRYLITVWDHGDEPRTSTSTMKLTIQDVNDEWPRFDKPAFFLDVAEHQEPYTVIGVINASDADSPLYNRIFYSLVSPANSDKFTVDGLTGELRTKVELDREKAARHELQVLAANQGAPSVNTSVNVTVRVLDINDHAPHIIFPSHNNNSVQMAQSVGQGYKVTSVVAEDDDIDLNGQLVYKISGGNEEDTFVIDERTGAIQVSKTDQIVAKKTFHLEVTVEDVGEPPHVAYEGLNIYVNSSLGATASGSILAGPNLIILVSVGAGFIIILLIIIVAIVCVRAHRRHLQKRHNYNSALDESRKINTDLDAFNRQQSDSSCDSMNLALESNPVENGHLGQKPKEKAKKEVTFSLDQDDASTWPLHGQPKAMENPHVASTDPLGDNTGQRQGDMFSVRHGGATRKVGGKGGSEHPQELHHHHHHHHHHVCRHHRRLPGMMYGDVRGPRQLTQGDLEMHDMLNSSVDHESECSCSGSITDSGRGPSEEGDNTLYGYPPPLVDPYYATEPRNGCCVDHPRAATILEEGELEDATEENGHCYSDPSNLDGPHQGPYPRPSSSLRHSPSKSSVDSQNSGRGPLMSRRPPRNPNCRGCMPRGTGFPGNQQAMPPLRSSLESVNSAPGRMDLVPKVLGRPETSCGPQCSEESLGSASDDTLPQSSSSDGEPCRCMGHHPIDNQHTPGPDVVPTRPQIPGYNGPQSAPATSRGNVYHHHYHLPPSNPHRQSPQPNTQPYGHVPCNHSILGYKHGSDIGSDNIPSHSAEYQTEVRPKGVRFCEQTQLEIYPAEDCCSTDCMSDDGTTTSGSYSVDPTDTERHKRQLYSITNPTEEGTCV